MYYYYYYYYYYSAFGLVWAGTRAQSGDRFGSGTLHSGQVLRGSLSLLSPAIYVTVKYEDTEQQGAKYVVCITINTYP